MRAASRPTDGKNLTRWLPLLERLEHREVPAVTAALSQVANWTELGPNVISNGQVSNITGTNPNGGAVNNPVIGTISALVAHPTDANIMYAGTPNGGVWRTTNAQAASPIWTPLTDDLASLSISDLSLDPANPNRLIVGIGGTADGAEAEQSGVVRGDLVGVLITEDASATAPTWRLVGGPLANKNITKVAIRGNTWVVGTDVGLYRSTDNGLTFTNIFSSSINNGVTYQDRQFNSRVYDLALNTRLPNQMYIATSDFAGLGKQIWRTDDSGETWGSVTDSQMQLSTNTTGVTISVRDNGELDNQVYVSVVNSFPTGAQQSLPGIGAIFAFSGRANELSSVTWSTNQGGNWTRMDNPRRMTEAEGLDLGHRRDINAYQGGGLRADGTRILVVTDGNGGIIPSPEDNWGHRLKTGDWVFIGGVTNYPPTDPPNPPPMDTIFDQNNGNINFFQVEVRDAYSFWLLNVTAPNDLMDSTGAFWQKVESVTAGEAGYADIVAAPANSLENLVYLGGDFNNYRFDAAGSPAGPGILGPFPSTFTGSIWQGNRFTVPINPGVNPLARGNANQWANLADVATANSTAPGGDTRQMLFDAAGNLWVATGTGVYKRNIVPGVAQPNNPTTSSWTNASGNIRVTQFWGVGYDTHSNLAVGATQDTGIVEQLTNGNLTYDAPLDRLSENFYADQAYAYEVAVDNTSNANQVTRYYVGSAFGFRGALGLTQGGIVRRVYNNAGGLISSGTLNLANALTTNAPLSGINAADIALGQDTSARVVMELNSNDRRRGAYGLTRVYEDSDPLGPGSTPVTGFVVSDVTPPGMNGRVRAMSYGGRRANIPFNQVMFVGTTSGQLWVRGEFGTTFTDTMGGSTNGFPVVGNGPVTDIQLDPDDYRHAFVAKGGEVYETRDLGVTWNRVSAGLVNPVADPLTGLPAAGSLTTQIYTIALFDPNPGTPNVGGTGDVVLLAGGRGGVFRRTISACGTDFVWSEYGNNLPNTVVMELDLQGTRLTAGTFGRGVWTIPDVTPTLTQTLFLDIIGDAAANNISLISDPLDPNAVIVSDGLGLNARFSFGQFDQIRVFALGGADTVTIASGLPSGGNLQFVDYPISINMGGDAGDRLVINDSGDTNNVQVTVNATTIGNAATDNIFDGCGSISYSGLQNGVLALLTGSGNDSIILANGVLPPTIELYGGAGDDTYYVNSLSTSSVFINDTAGNDTLSVTMSPGQTAFVDAANKTLVVAGLNVTGTGIDAFALDATAPSASVVWTASGGNDYALLMQDTLPGWSRLSLAGFQTRFRNMNNVTVNMLGGTDVLQVDSNGLAAGGTTQFVNYKVTANMGGNLNDTLLIDSSGSTANVVAGIDGLTVGNNPSNNTLFGGGFLNYTGLNNGLMDIRSGAGNDRLFFSAAATLRAAVTGGAGADEVWTNGTAGNDLAVALNNSLRNNAMNVAATFGVEQYGVTGGGGSDVLYTYGTAGNDALTISQQGIQSATVGGIPVPTAYQGVQTVVLNGNGGTDSLAWSDKSNTTYGTAINPSAGLVYAPTSSSSGVLFMGGAAGSSLTFLGVGGSFSANGDPTGSNTRDVFSILGVSSASVGGSFGEITAANGSDTISATDAGVTITNASLGLLKGVSFGQTPGGFLGFSTVFVRGGNEAGTGDTFTTRTTTRTNLMLDGGAPTALPGDSLTVTTNGPAATTSSGDPTLGPPHTRITSRVDQSSIGYLNFEQVTAITPDPGNPNGPPIPSFGSSKSDLFAVGSDAGATAQVKVYNLDGSLRFDLFPFGGFTGGVRVAVGDVTGDGKSDFVVAAGPGGGPIVKVYNGQTGQEVRSFYAYDPSFTAGVSVAVGNFNNDPYADIVTGAGPGGGPHVRLFNGLNGAEIYGFFAYSPNFTGGVNVAAADVTGDGLADIITGTATGAPHVKAFNGQTLAETLSFFAFDPSFQGGVNVAGGDITNDGKADLIVGAGQGGATQVRVFDAASGGLIRDFVVNDPTIPGTPPINVTGGVRVAAADFDGDGLMEVVTGRGRGSRPFAQVLKVSTLVGGSVQPSLTSLQAINVFGNAYSNGIYVGA